MLMGGGGTGGEGKSPVEKFGEAGGRGLRKMKGIGEAFKKR